MEKDKIRYNLANEFHMLRHFVGITNELYTKLIKSSITVESIERELRQPGSRFYPEFAVNIQELLERASMNVYDEEIGVNGNIVLKGKADRIRYLNGIGTLSVVHLDTIPEEDRTLIYLQKNRGVELLHFKVHSLPYTNDYTIILKPTKSRPVFITAFPGPPCMPLPERSLKKSLYDQYRTFWNSHVFLVQ
jgi:hypothetical protein